MQSHEEFKDSPQIKQQQKNYSEVSFPLAKQKAERNILYRCVVPSDKTTEQRVHGPLDRREGVRRMGRVCLRPRIQNDRDVANCTVWTRRPMDA